MNCLTNCNKKRYEEKVDFLISFLFPVEMFTYFCYNQFDKLEEVEQVKI